jgi:hypothetical protein
VTVLHECTSSREASHNILAIVGVPLSRSIARIYIFIGPVMDRVLKDINQPTVHRTQAMEEIINY